jgi:hypothetical protein
LFLTQVLQVKVVSANNVTVVVVSLFSGSGAAGSEYINIKCKWSFRFIRHWDVALELHWFRYSYINNTYRSLNMTGGTFYVCGTGTEQPLLYDGNVNVRVFYVNNSTSASTAAPAKGNLLHTTRYNYKNGYP